MRPCQLACCQGRTSSHREFCGCNMDAVPQRAARMGKQVEQYSSTFHVGLSNVHVAAYLRLRRAGGHQTDWTHQTCPQSRALRAAGRLGRPMCCRPGLGQLRPGARWAALPRLPALGVGQRAWPLHCSRLAPQSLHAVACQALLESPAHRQGQFESSSSFWVPINKQAKQTQGRLPASRS